MNRNNTKLYGVVLGYGLLASCPTFAQTTENAQLLYKEKCAYCHGDNGDGQSYAAHNMLVKPTSFVNGNYKYRTTPYGQFPTDQDLEKTISNGLQGTAMPAWSDLLSSEQITSLAQYVKSLSKIPAADSAAIAVPTQKFADANIADGEKVYQESGCINCHGVNLDGQEDRIRRIKANIKEGVAARDLTDHRNFRGGASLSDIYTRIYTGLNGTMMQGYGNVLTEKNIVDVSAYIKSVYEEKEKTRWTNDRQETIEERGDYLLSISVCEICHSPMNEDGSVMQGLAYAGGMKVTNPADGVFYARNITSDKDSGIGNWSIEQLKRAIKFGETPDGGSLYGLTMPFLFFSTMEDRDAEAIAMALKRIPPIYNKIPPAQTASFWQSFTTKIKVMLGSMERTLTFVVNNAGERNPEVGKNIPDYPSERHWSIFPPMGIISAEKIRKTAGLDLPIPEPTGSKEMDAKLSHGRYLVSITPCNTCHTATTGRIILKGAESLSGGMRIELNHLNTTYSANLTPDPITGLGNWSDSEIRRALKSGIKKDGTIMPYQGMPWAMFANMTEADTEAVIAYLRSIPPVYKKMPEVTPSNSADYIVSDRDFGIKN
ncbi:c-type cytochrome [Methylobacter sp. YRD-M1]|uniref:c-type cytochrome n=1 Tax=Methylobacter sp. YRD-M1 TaxID=2911520 RepID=UPI00227B4411|nr:c-type cytochrome [Methylobacter sp. YRD-M1]WAK01050.1 c-type cytochrome [Methylobacter sp. YRD-M1]